MEPSSLCQYSYLYVYRVCHVKFELFLIFGTIMEWVITFQDEMSSLVSEDRSHHK